MDNIYGGAEDQVSMTVHDYEDTSCDSDGDSPSATVSSSDQFRDFAASGMVRLDQEDEREYGVIKRGFLVGMAYSGVEVDVVAVHKNSYSGDSGKAKSAGFQTYCQAVAARRGGDANVKYAWYGGSRDEIRDVLRYGFGRCGDFEKGVSHGVGVYLSAANFPIDCASRAKEDENGVKHMLLCRVILGNTETIRAGSNSCTQVQPILTLESIIP